MQQRSDEVLAGLCARCDWVLLLRPMGTPSRWRGQSRPWHDWTLSPSSRAGFIRASANYSYYFLCAQVLTSWQAHGAKLEAVRAEFQTDPQSMRDILRLWQRHGHQINAYLESGEAQALQNGAKGLPEVKGAPATNGALQMTKCSLNVRK